MLTVENILNGAYEIGNGLVQINKKINNDGSSFKFDDKYIFERMSKFVYYRLDENRSALNISNRKFGNKLLKEAEKIVSNNFTITCDFISKNY